MVVQSFYYLISSLPFLKMDQASFETYESFLNFCWPYLEKKLLQVLGGLDISSSSSDLPQNSKIHEYYQREYLMRYELFKLRSLKKGKKIPDTEESMIDLETKRLAKKIFDSRSIREAEELLDLFRWNSIDQVSSQLFFEFDQLIGYAIKLKMALKRSKYNLQKGQQKLHELIRPFNYLEDYGII